MDNGLRLPTEWREFEPMRTELVHVQQIGRFRKAYGIPVLLWSMILLVVAEFKRYAS